MNKVFLVILQYTCKQPILHHSHHIRCWFHTERECKGTGKRRCRPGWQTSPEKRAARAPWCLIRPGAKPALRRLETERVRWAPPVSGEQPDPPTPPLGQHLLDQPQSGLIFYLPGLTRLCKADTSYDKSEIMGLRLVRATDGELWVFIAHGGYGGCGWQKICFHSWAWITQLS